MEYLHYNIAGHSFIIETPDSFVTKTLIPTFDNFLKTDGEEERDVLFRFIGNCNIVVPKLDPVEDIITEGINFKVYIEGGVTTVYLIRIMSDGTIRVYGAPWSGSTPCYRNIFADLSAFVFLQQSSENLLYKLDGLTSFSVLLKSTSIMRCDNKNRLMIISVIYEILEKASVYRLNNRPEKEAVALRKLC